MKKYNDTDIVNILRLTAIPNLYLSPKKYCEFWGISRPTLDKALKENLISEDNGNLSNGGSVKSAHKRILRFTNPFTGKLELPKIFV